MKTRVNGKVIVVGGGLGGLSAAIHLRLAGFDVTLLEACERVGGRANLIEHEGFRFDTGPSLLNYPWVFEQLFEAAGRRLRDYVRLLPVDPSITFRWTGGERFTLSSDLQKFLAECERMEPGSTPSVFAFLRDAGGKFRVAFDKLVSRKVDNPAKWLGALTPAELLGTSLWRSVDGQLRRHFKSRHVREALGSYAMYLGGSPYDLPGMFTILPYGELAYGLWLPEGGVYGLVEGIERLARELGVELRTGTRVSRIVCRDGRVRAVELASGELIEASLVVSNVDVPTTDTELVIDPLAAGRLGYWTWAHGGVYHGVPFTNFVGWFVTALLASRIIGARGHRNVWAAFVGTAIVLFFALNALSNSLLPVALVGFALCAARLTHAARSPTRPS